MRKLPVALVLCSLSLMPATKINAQTLPAGYWPPEKSQPLIDKTQTIRLAPDISHLTTGEKAAVAKLIEVGKIFQELYEQQRHPEATRAYRDLLQLDKRLGSRPATENLLTLYRLFQGPIATTLENRREPFLPVEGVQPGKSVYPWGVKKEEIDAFLTAHPEKRDAVLDLRTVVRRATPINAQKDLATLRTYPALDTLHPGLKAELTRLSRGPARGGNAGFYAVPYSVAYAPELTRAHDLLHEAADAVQGDDDEFARYLRNRARDLLTDDYTAIRIDNEQEYRRVLELVERSEAAAAPAGPRREPSGTGIVKRWIERPPRSSSRTSSMRGSKPGA